MSKNNFRIVVTILLIVFLAGCGLKARVFKERRERQDQAIAGVEPAVKKTREVYVLEVTKKKPAKQEPVSPFAQETAAPVSGIMYEPLSAHEAEPPSNEQNFANNAANTTGFASPELPAQYTVQKDDTMQKISKKLYNSYSKWPKIYEANKDKITDPNRIKSGITITIPKI